MPVAVNGSAFPSKTLGFAGVTAIDCRTAAVTVSTVVPVMLPSVAEIVDEPTANVVARPAAEMAPPRGWPMPR